MLRSPATHFLVLGAMLYALQGIASVSAPARAGQAGRAEVVVGADDLARMRTLYEQSVGGEPDDAALQSMIERFVENEVLYREALALGLERADQTVRWRLIEKMQYLGEAEEGDAAEEVFERALALGLQRDDPIVKDVLVDKYRMLVRYAHGAKPITEQQLRDYYERNRDRFANPDRVSFSHVFFSRQRRGERTRADAEAALARLRSAAMSNEDAVALGDPFLSGHLVKSRTAQGVGRLFGEGFASAVLMSREGGWTGPVESAYGQHLVYVSARSGGGTMPFESVRSQVARAAENELREMRLRQKLTELRDRYEVVIRDDAAAVDDDA